MPPDRAKATKEAGDLWWYIAHLLTTVDQPLDAALAAMRVHPLPRRGAVPLVQLLLDLMIDAGKLADYLKKVSFHKINIDVAKMHELLLPVGRGLLTLLAHEELVAEDVFADNIAKLRARYPAGFNTADSIARKDGERMEEMISMDQDECCSKCGAPRTQTPQVLYTDPVRYLWQCSGCGDEVYLDEPSGLAVADRPSTDPPCAHTDPPCTCVCHTNTCILHDHACCSPCGRCGFRVPCACEHCRRAPSAPSAR
jgi:hypothetical protein